MGSVIEDVYFEGDNHEFRFHVPAGTYHLITGGSYLHVSETTFTVKAGQTNLDLGAIGVTATRLGLLNGKAAPKLEGIKCWKNSDGLELESLKGKCVILDFWGYWCGPCVGGMPALFELYDKHHKEGLEIIGIHVDMGNEEPVDTVEKLDGRLVNIQQDVWKGRDIPYPVALTARKESPFLEVNVQRKAPCEMAAIYGVTNYPTLILIDRNGNVAGRFHPGIPKYMARLKELLEQK